MAYTISQVCGSYAMAQVEALLKQEGIEKDGNLDYTCAMYDEDYNPIATGSCFGNTLRCFAVSRDHQGEGLLNEVVTHLINYQYDRGNYALFLYTKPESVAFFHDLGFYEIARAEGQAVFMENRRTGFASYLKGLGERDADGVRSAAVVMNANPFTLGHRYLLEKASRENDVVHLFLVSEDASVFPFAVRKKLVEQGTADLKNLVLHDSGPYIISSATFPSYFLKDEMAVVQGHARLDLAVFTRIARALGISRLYVGEEPTSATTSAYNQVMAEQLPRSGIECVIVPRLEEQGRAISASTVRQCIQREDWAELSRLVPETTLQWLQSPQAAPVRAKIKAMEQVVHH